MAGRSARGEVEVRGVRLSSPDKVLYDDQGITKAELAHYYESVADWILPYLARRPLSLVRCPQGEAGECFYQRHAHKGLPKAIKSVALAEKEGEQRTYLYLEDIEGLLSCVQFGTLEMHPWGSRIDSIDKPDWMIFDLDPDEGLDFARVRQAARDVRGVLESVGLKSFLKTTGGKGLHVTVPLERRHGWGEVKAFAEAVAKRIAEANPDHYVATMSKDRRRGRVFIDYFRNDRSATSVAPYSTRARSGAPVAVPLRWEELGKLNSPAKYAVANTPRRLAQIRRDPWEGFFDLGQRLTKAAARELGADL